MRGAVAPRWRMVVSRRACGERGPRPLGRGSGVVSGASVRGRAAEGTGLRPEKDAGRGPATVLCSHPPARSRNEGVATPTRSPAAHAPCGGKGRRRSPVHFGMDLGLLRLVRGRGVTKLQGGRPRRVAADRRTVRAEWSAGRRSAVASRRCVGARLRRCRTNLNLTHPPTRILSGGFAPAPRDGCSLRGVGATRAGWRRSHVAQLAHRRGQYPGGQHPRSADGRKALGGWVADDVG
jgi:hypothetical protein